MFSRNHPIILLLDRNGFSVFQDTLSGIPKFNFTPDIVANLDIINEVQLKNLVATFIQINKIIPSSLAIILSDNVIYAKDIPLQNQDKEQKQEIQNFLENIPFEEILAKVIKTNRLNRVVVVNKRLISSIADAFAKKGSILEAIIPTFLYGQNIDFSRGLTTNNLQAVLGGSEILRIGNLLLDQQIINPFPNFENESRKTLEKESKKPQSLRAYILIGIFVVLLIVLGVVYLNSDTSTQGPAPVKNTEQFPASTNIPTLVPTLAVSSATSSADMEDIKIKIIDPAQPNVSTSGETAGNLKDELLKIGFQNIEIEVSYNTSPEKSSVIFSKNISFDIRNIAISEIKKILQNVVILENQDSDSAITISIAKS